MEGLKLLSAWDGSDRKFCIPRYPFLKIQIHLCKFILFLLRSFIRRQTELIFMLVFNFFFILVGNLVLKMPKTWQLLKTLTLTLTGITSSVLDLICGIPQ